MGLEILDAAAEVNAALIASTRSEREEPQAVPNELIREPGMEACPDRAACRNGLHNKTMEPQTLQVSMHPATDCLSGVHICSWARRMYNTE